MEGLELICFNIISMVGSARSCYIEAIHRAKEGDFSGADKLVAEGDENFTEGHHAHADLIQQEAAEGSVEFSLLLLHAEDQLMSAEAFGILAKEFIDVYKAIQK